MLPVAVLAGGLGTRLADLAGNLPKALLPVGGRPFIDVKLASLADQGVNRVVLLLAHGAEAIMRHLGDGERFGLSIEYALDGAEPAGTGGALRGALELLDDSFWVTYGDTYLRAPMEEAEAAFFARRLEGLMTVYRNRDRWDRSNVKVQDGLIVEYKKGAPPGTFSYIDYGLSILTKNAMSDFPAGSSFDLSEAFYPLIDRRGLMAFEVSERFYDIGTPASYHETDKFFRKRGPTAGRSI